MSAARCFSKIDLTLKYSQTCMVDLSTLLKSFNIRFGAFKPEVFHFELSNARESLLYSKNYVFSKVLENFVDVYSKNYIF